MDSNRANEKEDPRLAQDSGQIGCRAKSRLDTRLSEID